VCTDLVLGMISMCFLHVVYLVLLIIFVYKDIHYCYCMKIKLDI